MVISRALENPSCSFLIYSELFVCFLFIILTFEFNFCKVYTLAEYIIVVLYRYYVFMYFRNVSFRENSRANPVQQFTKKKKS